MPKEELQQLKENKEKARQFVMYHTVEGTIHADAITSDKVKKNQFSLGKNAYFLVSTEFAFYGSEEQPEDAGGTERPGG